jgi:hypothetical protein
MFGQKTIQPTTPEAPHNAQAPPAAGGGTQQQANKFAEIARRARENCDKGADAEKMLQARRNRGGQ